jgi:hypothetical protein
MENSKIVKRYFDKYFKHQYLTENDLEFKALVKILNKKDKPVNSIGITDEKGPEELEYQLKKKVMELLDKYDEGFHQLNGFYPMEFDYGGNDYKVLGTFHKEVRADGHPSEGVPDGHTTYYTGTLGVWSFDVSTEATDFIFSIDLND